jgi:hypothetical protein
MNTIPTTINASLPAYTAVGGGERRGSTGLSLVLLNRPGRQSRAAFFQEIGKEGFDYVVSIEGTQKRYDLEELSAAFPFVRFILLSEAVSPGEAVNLAASELSSPLFFVLWNDFRFVRGGGAERIADRLLSSREFSSRGEAGGRVCTVPVIANARVETLATLSAPAIGRGVIRTIPFTPSDEGLPTLYPFEGTGIYDRERFLRSGGFDGAMKNFRWQLLDFGFRSWLWGEEIAATLSVKLCCESAVPVEDSTLDASYRRFCLKNLAPVFRRDHAHIPLRAFPGYAWRSGNGVLSAWEEFAVARAWVRVNRYRWRRGVKEMSALWGDRAKEG